MAAHPDITTTADSSRTHAPGRLSQITCPVQRVLASHLQAIEDIFCAGFAEMVPAERFVRQEPKEARELKEKAEAEYAAEVEAAQREGRKKPRRRKIVFESKILSTPEERVRNLMRMPALGCAIRLGLELGLKHHALHGHHAGYTEILELADLHHNTIQKARLVFDALIADKGAVGKFVRGQWTALLSRAKADAQGLVPVSLGRGPKGPRPTTAKPRKSRSRARGERQAAA